MSRTRTSPGLRTDGVGPFRFCRRVRGTLSELGRLYRARHRNGDAALVLVPTVERLDGAPQLPLSVRVSASPEPAYVALEVEGATAASPEVFQEELLGMLEDARDMVRAAVREPDVAEHLMSRFPPRVYSPPSHFLLDRALLSGAIALAVLAVAVWLRPPEQQLDVDNLPDVETTVVLSDNLDFSSNKGKSWTIPDEGPVLKEQRLPPCDPTQYEINGACWVQVLPKPGSTPPSRTCPEGIYEHGGNCYSPAGKPKDPNRSMDGRKP